ncbi:hypothetical protein KDK95_17520 [Actinospica sp. MGRD01-02]|uniref:Uncharacterized protein n=1 Tax=Actinospica acidithermotolerans TaxID=2828514 RepID=A0A941EAS5_9ACTN|nr:hypothetical protein [Actinospica acidithermotolerans]MBR7828121.1 hypothetical protein [Actinospica acidithermotolerans]
MNLIKHRYLVSALVSATAGVAALGLIAGCSSGSGSAAAAGAATGSAGSGYTAYLSCLSQHGVKVPTNGAFAGRRSHSAGAGFTPVARRSGSGGFPGLATSDPTVAAAVQACASLRPTGGAGFGGGTRLAAFRDCMTQQGETVPTTRPAFAASATARPTGDARYLGGLDPADPKVAAALKVCEPLIPTASAHAAPSASGTSTS